LSSWLTQLLLPAASASRPIIALYSLSTNSSFVNPAFIISGLNIKLRATDAPVSAPLFNRLNQKLSPPVSGALSSVVLNKRVKKTLICAPGGALYDPRVIPAL
jgi:hypothetical protein